MTEDKVHVWFSTSRQVKLMPIVLKKYKNCHKKLSKRIDSKFTKQWRIAKLISRQKWRTQCTQQELKLSSGCSHSRSINAMLQRKAKSSSKDPPNTQRKKNNPTDIPAIMYDNKLLYNKANLRDLIAATGLVISNRIKIVNFSARVTVKFDGWPCKTIGHLFYATSSFVHHFVAIGEFKLEL